MNVVNDKAGRAVALIQSFNTRPSMNEEQLQYILHILEKHRQLFQSQHNTQFESKMRFFDKLISVSVY